MKFNLLLFVCFFTFSTHLFSQGNDDMKTIEMELDNILMDTTMVKACCSKNKDCKCGTHSGCCNGMAKDSCCVASKGCCGSKYKNVLGVTGRYYFNSLNNTRTLLAANGYPLDEYALEIQVRLYNLPKVFYYQQMGTLTQAKYASVIGFGVKQDVRWNIIKNSPFFFTPYVEVGGGYYRMNLVKGVTSNSIETVLNATVETNHAENFVLTGDIGVDLGVGFKIDNTRLSILLNGGYLANVPTQWRLAGSLAFKEKINIGSPYVGATVRLEVAR